MFVKDWMTADPVYLEEQDTLYAAYRLMLERDIRHLPILDSQRRVSGILTQNDVMAATERALQEATGGDVPIDAMRFGRIADHMTDQPITVEPGTTIEVAALTLRAHGIGGLPVVRDGTLVGILTETDVLSALVDALGLERGGARMVQTAEGDVHDAVNAMLDRLDRDELRLSSLTTYHGRGDGPARLVGRVRGAGV